MLHTNNDKIKEYLLKGNFGLEKENLRILTDGTLSLTPHPFPGDRHIERDFSENQTEINTPVFPTPEKAQESLLKYTKLICQKLRSLPAPELLWPFSNPPHIKNESDLPIAQFSGPLASKTRYREYLSDRYGRYKMALCGIHVNYSFSEDLLSRDFSLSGACDYQEYKNQLYVELAEKAAAYGWVVTALTSASPLLDGSYNEKGVRGKTSFNGMASMRCSELGYWNYFSPYFDYTDLDTYVSSIQTYVDREFIIAPTELYYPIRLKPRGAYSLKSLKEDGVDHIELRMIDLNPLEISGIHLNDLKFIQLFLLWLASTPMKKLLLKDQIQAAANFKNAAHYDLKTVKILVPGLAVESIADAGIKVLEEMKTFYQDFPQDVRKVLEFEEEKFVDPQKRYAWIIRRKYEEDFLEKGLKTAKEQAGLL